MPRLNLFTCLLLGLGFSPFSIRAQLYELPFEDIIDQSALIVEGRVTAQRSFWDTGEENIYTASTVEVFRVNKGSAPVPAVVEVITPGGIVGNRMELVSESVQYAVGQYGLFCLVPAKGDLPVAPAWENYGSPHGFFQYDFLTRQVEHPFHPDPDIDGFRQKIRRYTGEPIVLIPEEAKSGASDRMVPSITSFSPASITAGTGSTLTINGSGFGAAPGKVRFVDSNSGSSRLADAEDILSWADGQITITVPSASDSGLCAGTGPITVVDQGGAVGVSATNLTVEYAYSNFVYSVNGNKYGAKLVDINGSGGLTFTLSTTICSAANQNAVNAFGRALREWRCVSGVNWQLSTTTAPNATIGSNGVSIVTFDSGTNLPAGVLGRATSYYTGCTSSGTLHWRVNEVDINIDQGTNWYYCDATSIPFNQYDFQSVLFHELGHAHQLSHIVNSSAVMHRSIANGQIKRTLNANEEACADYVLNLPANPCGPSPMTLVTPGSCQTINLPSGCNGPGPCTVSLPVELTGFSGTARQEGILLEWETATEWNNDYFTVEHSNDRFQFTPLTKVPGAAVSSQPRRYAYLHATPEPGINYYRLWQTDLDGSREALSLIAVSFGSDPSDTQVFPNPAPGGTVFIQTSQADAGAVLELTLTDLSGRLIRRTLQEWTGNSLPFDLGGVSPGTYLFFVTDPATRRHLQQTVLVKQ